MCCSLREQVTIALLSMASANGIAARSFLGDQVAVQTDHAFGKARIEHIDTQKLSSTLEQGAVPVVAGFQGVNSDGDIMTSAAAVLILAVALAAALQADECEICTDVDGVYTADPRIISNARRLGQPLKKCSNWQVLVRKFYTSVGRVRRSLQGATPSPF